MNTTGNKDPNHLEIPGNCNVAASGSIVAELNSNDKDIKTASGDYAIASCGRYWI